MADIVLVNDCVQQGRRPLAKVLKVFHCDDDGRVRTVRIRTGETQVERLISMLVTSLEDQ